MFFLLAAFAAPDAPTTESPAESPAESEPPVDSEPTSKPERAQPAAWTVTVDPLTFALGFAHVQVERRLTRHTSLYVGPHLRLFNGILSDRSERYRGYGGEVGLRVFPWGRAPSGAWGMVRSTLAYVHTTDGSARARPGGYSSVLVGYSGILAKHFVLSGGVGFNYLYYDIGDYGTSGPFVALHTNLGVAF